MECKVSLIGAGPGDPGLLTVKGRDILLKADVIIYDALANPDLLSYARSDAEIIYVGKVADKHALPQAEINELLAQKAREGKLVARLKGGDPYIFGRGGEEGEYLLERGIAYEEIPGISSAIAAPAYAGIPVTHRDFASSVILITGHENPAKGTSAHNWQAFAQSGSTLVFVMGMRNLESICKNLLDNGLSPDTPAAIIYRGTTPCQKNLFSVLKKLPAEAKKAGLTSPAVIVIGKTVELHQKLNWFGAKPLLGRTIVVTRAREQASGMVQLLEDMGANVIQFPLIKIEPLADYSILNEAITKLEEYHWIIFTSANGVKFFWQKLKERQKDSRALGKAKIAAIGPATAKALQEKGIDPDFIPESYVAESILEGLLAKEKLDKKRILIPRAVEARTVLPEALTKAGAIVDVAPAYLTIPAQAGKDKILSLLSEGAIDCITFGSSSTVRNFFDMIPVPELEKVRKPILATIGPVTTATLNQFGLESDIEPSEYTIPALVQAIANYFAVPPQALENRNVT